MKLWLIERYGKSLEDGSYDEFYEHVVRAPSEEEVRRLASEKHGDEGPHIWLDPSMTRCSELTAEAEAEVVISDFSAG